MIKKILIANRGEIAVRVIKTCNKLNIKAVAIYSDVDQNALFVELADEAYGLSGIDAHDTYLNIDKILDVAKRANCDAIHPGYGFLSENAEFATRVIDSGLKFIGPTADAILAMGMKSTAKHIMQDANVPVLPGYHDDDNTDAKLISEANKIGFPLLVKAAAGGGGKGMRIVENKSVIKSAIDSAKRESKKSFANDKLILEKFLQNPRHIEVQVLFDNFGNGIYLHERDCSIQRRYQKIIEEAPAFNLDNSLRKKLGDTALKAAKAINYVGAGTIEFLLDTIDNSFYFMEMNTRLQVEHPVTEMITGLDLVELQIQVASGEKLSLKQNDVQLNGHAVEARLYAEDIANNFLPASGTIKYVDFYQNEGIRIDTGIQTGDQISIHYDPMLAKVIAYGDNREQAINNLIRSLKNTFLIGVKNNIEFLSACLKNNNFIIGNISTNFISDNAQDLDLGLFNNAAKGYESNSKVTCTVTNDLPWIAAALYYNFFSESKDLSQKTIIEPWDCYHNFKLNLDNESVFYINSINLAEHLDVKITTTNNGFCSQAQNGITELKVGDNKYFCDNINLEDYLLSFSLRANNSNKSINCEIKIVFLYDNLYLLVNNKQYSFNTNLQFEDIDSSHHSKGSLSAPMHGTVVAINVNAGQVVTQGDTLLVLEAMKMEHAITAPKSGTISAINYSQGQQVNEGAELLVME